MKTITLTCSECSKSFTKPLKEHTRQIKKHGPDRLFFCSRSCSCIYFNNATPRNYSGWGKVAISNAAKTNTLYSKEDKPFAEHLRRCRNRKKHSFDLTIEYVKDIWEKQNNLCAISNIPITLDTSAEDYNCASLDRIDSKKGYIRGNVQWVSRCINHAKGTMTDQQCHSFLKKICESYLQT